MDLPRINSNPGDYWAVFVPSKLSAAGLTKQQVQAVWVLEGQLSVPRGFPNGAYDQAVLWEQLLRTIKTQFPNVKQALCTTPGYGGYRDPAPALEPQMYEEAFALKWTIEAQIADDPGVSYKSGVAPWLSWAAYHWCDGVRPRGDGLTWECPEDVMQDGLHPSSVGADKVARMLLDFMLTDSATSWFRK